MTSIGPMQQASLALPSIAPRPCGVPASTATADFATLLRAVGQGSPPVSSTGSVGQAEWLAYASRRPDIEAALALFHMARRLPSSPASKTGRSPSGTLANLPKSTDCNAAEGLSHSGNEEIACACAQAYEVDRSGTQHQEPLARQGDPRWRDLVDGVTVQCVPAVATPSTVWPLPWIGWPFYPSFQRPLQVPRVPVWRRRFFFPSVDKSADESGGDGRRERG